MYFLRFLVCVFLLLAFIPKSKAAVILQYHHVADDTPKNTTISPKQFEAHLYYLFDNEFKVWPLNRIIETIKAGQTLPDKVVAITFDDGYRDVLENATPLLNKFSYPYTIFISPEAIDLGYQDFLTWKQIKTMSDSGVIFANHGLNHESVLRHPDEMDESEWQKLLVNQINLAEERIKKETGQNWQFYAYPYGEYSSTYQTLLEQQGYVAFSQQSGAFNHTTDLTALPRFPVSQPYDDMSALRDKLNALPLELKPQDQRFENLINYGDKPYADFHLLSRDFRKNSVNCYVSGMGLKKPVWHSDLEFNLDLDKKLSPGRRRSNCTVQSISKPGRFYWYSRPWFVKRKDGSWYPR